MAIQGGTKVLEGGAVALPDDSLCRAVPKVDTLSAPEAIRVEYEQIISGSTSAVDVASSCRSFNTKLTSRLSP